MVDAGSLIAALVQKLVPSTFEQFIWWGIGGGLARSFGKQLDYDIKKGEWYKSLSPVMQNIVARLLDFTHHWWVGGLVMLYGLPNVSVDISYWLGAGIFVDDLPDLYKRIDEMIKTIAKYLGKK